MVPASPGETVGGAWRPMAHLASRVRQARMSAVSVFGNVPRTAGVTPFTHDVVLRPGGVMQVRYTLTGELPTYCLGLWETRQEAEAFLQSSGLTSEGISVTPVFYA